MTVVAPAASPTARATLSMPMLSWRSAISRTTVSSSSGSRRSRAAARSAACAVERLALVVRRDRALDQPPRLVGGHVAEHLEVGHVVGQRHLGPEELGERHPVLTLHDAGLVALPGLPPQRRGEREPQPHLEEPQLAGVLDQLAAAPLADEPPDHERDQPDERTAQRRRGRHVAELLADPGDLALGLAGDVGVALEQLVDRGRVGLAQGDVDADPAAGGLTYVGQHRPGVQHDVAAERRLELGVVGRQHEHPAAVEEDRQPDDHRDRQPDGHGDDRADVVPRPGSGDLRQREPRDDRPPRTHPSSLGRRRVSHAVS